MKTLCIDLRWIDSCGVGVYINDVMPRIVERLRDVAIEGIGDRARLLERRWYVLGA
jgi:hypothetical protein